MPRTQARPTGGPRPAFDPRWVLKPEVWGAVLGALSLLAALALLSIIGGAAGKAIARALRSLFGWGTYPMVALSLAGAAVLAGRRYLAGRVRILPTQALGLEFLLFGILGLLHTPFPPSHGFAAAQAGLGGGYLGWTLVYILGGVLGRLGATLAVFALTVSGLVLVYEDLWMLVSRASERLLPALARWMWTAVPTAEELPPPAEPAPSPPPVTPPPPAKRKAPAAAPVRSPGAATPRPARPRARNPHLPSLDLLAAGSALPEDDAGVRYQSQLIEETLAHFGVPAQVVDVQRGPTVTQFGVEPGFVERKHAGGEVERRKVRVSRIVALANDLALALAVPSIRIEAPVPGRPLVGIEIPNRQTALVNLRTVMESDAFRRIRSPLRVALGQDVSGRPVAADLATMPHLLIAGATGSGKSVCVNSLIACLLLENTPDDLKLLLVDPKRVELTGFAGVPHLAAPVVVDVDQTVLALRWTCQEMDRRYKLFAQARVRNIEGLNSALGRRRGARLPYLVILVDEMADVMMLAPDEVERSLCRIAQMGRATGIHLVVATQRPSIDVVTGLIKANFPARIAFAVSTQVDSRVILDAAGAEQLLGRGDMLFMSPEANRLLRLQGCFVSDEELAAIADHWRQTVEAEPDQDEPAPWDGLAVEEDEEDSLLAEAIALVRQHGQASTSFLQRRLRLGYSRAARLMDQLEERGVVGPDPGGGRSRQVFAGAFGETGDETGSEDEE